MALLFSYILSIFIYFYHIFTLSVALYSFLHLYASAWSHFPFASKCFLMTKSPVFTDWKCLYFVLRPQPEKQSTLECLPRPLWEPGCPGQHGQDRKFIPSSWVGQASGKTSVGQKSEVVHYLGLGPRVRFHCGQIWTGELHSVPVSTDQHLHWTALGSSLTPGR